MADISLMSVVGVGVRSSNEDSPVVSWGSLDLNKSEKSSYCETDKLFHLIFDIKLL
jgi:hypothetical protein